MYYIFLAEGFEELEMITILDILRRAQIDIKTVSISTSNMVKGSHGVEIKTDIVLNELNIEKIKGIILPGGIPGATNLQKNEELKELILEINNQNKLLAAICAAPLVFGMHKILSNRKATCYPGFEEYLENAIIVDEDVVVDKNIITSKGPATASKFAYELVKYIKDELLAKSIFKGMLFNIK